MALPGQTLADIREVFTPMALLQCKQFFKPFEHIKLVKHVDTAEVAKRIAKHQLKALRQLLPELQQIYFT